MQVRLPVLRGVDGGVEFLLRGRQPSRGGVEIVEAEDRGDVVVHLGRLAVDQVVQVGVGEEGAVCAGRPLPAGLLQRHGAVSRPPEHGLGVGEGVSGPGAGEGARRRVALDGQPGLDDGPLALVQVAPADGVARVLAGAVGVGAGEQGLDRLGDARLAGAVASHDEGHAGLGLQLEQCLGADAAEAGDRDVPQVDGARGGPGSAFGVLGVAERSADEGLHRGGQLAVAGQAGLDEFGQGQGVVGGRIGRRVVHGVSRDVRRRGKGASTDRHRSGRTVGRLSTDGTVGVGGRCAVSPF